MPGLGHTLRVETPPNKSREKRSSLIVVASGEPSADRPAGPAIRAAGLAAGLRARGLSAEVRSVVPDESKVIPEAEVVVVNLSVAAREPTLLAAPYIVVDAAGPYLVESLWVNAARSLAERRAILGHEADAVARVLGAADLILVAHEAQRSFVLGLLLGRGLLRPELIDRDPELAGLIAVVPFGLEQLPPEPPPHEQTGPLHVVWPGGLWDWLDPLTAVRGVALARASGADVRLSLWGTGSPDPNAPRARLVDEIQREIARAKLQEVVELVDWIPYEEYSTRLGAADLAITLDPGGIEARFAYRTRLVHALAAGVPTLATAGEEVATRAAAFGAGWTVPPRDPSAVGALLSDLASDRARLEGAREQTRSAVAGLLYDDLVEPLARFCANPRTARPGRGPLRLRGRARRLLEAARSASPR